MKKLTLATILLALCFATGFTCSKNTPPATSEAPQADATTTAPTEGDQSQMATAPAQAAPEGTAAATATEAAPAATENK